MWYRYARANQWQNCTVDTVSIPGHCLSWFQAWSAICQCHFQFGKWPFASSHGNLNRQNTCQSKLFWKLTIRFGLIDGDAAVVILIEKHQIVTVVRAFSLGHSNDFDLETFHVITMITLAELFVLFVGYRLGFVLQHVDLKLHPCPFRPLRLVIHRQIKAHLPMRRLKCLYKKTRSKSHRNLLDLPKYCEWIRINYHQWAPAIFYLCTSQMILKTPNYQNLEKLRGLARI